MSATVVASSRLIKNNNTTIEKKKKKKKNKKNVQYYEIFPIAQATVWEWVTGCGVHYSKRNGYGGVLRTY